MQDAKGHSPGMPMIAVLEAGLLKRIFKEPMTDWLARPGLLLRRVMSGENRIVDHSTTVPAQWNIHPGGISAPCLSRVDVDNRRDAKAKAHRVVQAIDPCVICQVRIH